MTKDSAKELLNNPALKLIAQVIIVLSSVGGGVYAVLSKIDKIDAKLDKVIAIQEGKDNLQDLRNNGFEKRVENVEADIKEINDWRLSISFSHQPAMKPKPIEVESE